MPADLPAMELFTDVPMGDIGAAAQKEEDAAGAPQSKRGRGAEVRSAAEVKKMEELMVLLSKLCLSSALQCRDHKAIVMDCVLIKTDSAWYREFKAATEKFTDTQRRLKDQGSSPPQIKNMIGIPSVHGFNALVKHALVLKPVWGKQLEEAVKLWASQDGWHTIHAHVPHCKISRMFHSTQKRLEVSVPQEHMVPLEDTQITEVAQLTPTWAWTRIKKLVLQDPDHHALEGIAPAGDLERRIQEFLDSQAGSSQ